MAINQQREPFGRWLLAQRDCGDRIDDLAKAARADLGFPREGSVIDVNARLIVLEAGGESFEQLDHARRVWRSL